MAQTTNHLGDLLEKIKGDAQRALALLPSEPGLRSLGWKCHCVRARQAFHAAGLCCSRRPLSEMRNRFFSNAVSALRHPFGAEKFGRFSPGRNRRILPLEPIFKLLAVRARNGPTSPLNPRDRGKDVF